MLSSTAREVLARVKIGPDGQPVRPEGMTAVYWAYAQRLFEEIEVEANLGSAARIAVNSAVSARESKSRTGVR